MYFYGARWYDPSLGRFIQPDTIVPQPGDAADWDRFAYVRNNPLKYTDPTGHVAVCFRGAPNSSKDDSAPDIVHQLCQQALEDAGYDETVHGEILYFHYNNLKHIRQAFEAIMARPAGEPAIVMGHSWGGAASLRLTHALKYYGDYLRAQTLVNEELAANTQIDLLITIDPERFGRLYTPKRVPDNVDFAMNIAPKDGWNFSSYPGQGGKDNGLHGLINAQHVTNKIQGALYIDVESVTTAQTGEVRMNHDTIVNLTAHTGEPPVINPVTQQYMTMSISAYVQ